MKKFLLKIGVITALSTLFLSNAVFAEVPTCPSAKFAASHFLTEGAMWSNKWAFVSPHAFRLVLVSNAENIDKKQAEINFHALLKSISTGPTPIAQLYDNKHRLPGDYVCVYAGHFNKSLEDQMDNDAPYVSIELSTYHS